MKATCIRVFSAGLVLCSPMVRASAQQMLWFSDSDELNARYGTTSLGPDLDGDGLPELLVSAPAASCTNRFDGFVDIVSTSVGVLHRWCGAGGWMFGTTAAWLDDVDSGGVPDVAIGEPNYLDASYYGWETGRIQVFSTETRQLLYEVVGSQSKAQFGWPLAVVDDCDGDGLRDVLVGGPRYGFSYEGKAWILSARDGSVIRTHDGTIYDERLGSNLIALEDVDGDGVRDYAIFAEARWGKVEVFSGAAGTELLDLRGSSYDDQLRYPLAGPGDLDGDGLGDLLINRWDGLAHVEAWSPASGALIWRIDGADPTETFGGWLAAPGDVDGDGHEEVLIAALTDSHAGKLAGRVDLVSGRTLRPLFRFYSPVNLLQYFGEVLGRGADFDGDGRIDLIIGALNGGWHKSVGGHVALYAGNDLWLQADPNRPGSNDLVTVDLRGAEAGTLGMVALVEVHKADVFIPLLVAPFDANGELQLTACTDPSVSGLKFTLLGFAESRRGKGPLRVSAEAIVSVQ